MPSPEAQFLEMARALILKRRGPGWRIRTIIISIDGPDGIQSEEKLRQGYPNGALEANETGRDRPDATEERRPNEAGSQSARRPDQTHFAGRRLTPTEQAVINTLQEAGRPLKGVVIEARLGKRDSSYLRGLLGKMVRKGILAHSEEGGYCLAEQPDAEA